VTGRRAWKALPPVLRGLTVWVALIAAAAYTALWLAGRLL
jgi:hypothetical protein